MTDDQIHNCDNDELDAKLHQLLIVEGNEEVVIQHPVDGEKIVTRESYLELKRHLNKAKNMSPAQRLVETTRLKNKNQIKFRTAMINAKVYEVDLNDDANFGVDINGTKLDIDGANFVPTSQYLPGIEHLDFEVGSFVHEDMSKPPIRIIAKEPLKKEV